MLWKLFTPDQWSALGTIVSAAAAALNLIVVVLLLVYTRSATKAAQAQAAVALRTLTELEEEKKSQNGRTLRYAEARLKDLGQNLLVLDGTSRSIHFAADLWKARPVDWHEVTGTVISFWPDGARKAVELDQKLRQIDLNLQSLAHCPVPNEAFHKGLELLRELVDQAQPLAREMWEGLMGSI